MEKISNKTISLETWYTQNSKTDFPQQAPILLYSTTVCEDSERITDCGYFSAVLAPEESVSGKLEIAIYKDATTYARRENGDAGEILDSETEILSQHKFNLPGIHSGCCPMVSLGTWYAQNANTDSPQQAPVLLYSTTLCEDSERITDCGYFSAVLAPEESVSGKLEIAIYKDTTTYARRENGDTGEILDSKTEMGWQNGLGVPGVHTNYEQTDSLETWYAKNTNTDFPQQAPILLYSGTLCEDEERITDCGYFSAVLTPEESLSGKVEIAIYKETTTYARKKNGDAGEVLYSETELVWQNGLSVPGENAACFPVVCLEEWYIQNAKTDYPLQPPVLLYSTTLCEDSERVTDCGYFSAVLAPEESLSGKVEIAFYKDTKMLFCPKNAVL